MTRGDEPISVISCRLHLSWGNRKTERVITGNDTAEFCFKFWHCIPVEEEKEGGGGGEGGGGEEEEEEEEENHGEYDQYLLPK
jgi:hypothetical protein